MSDIKIPCPDCTDGFTSHGDRQARTAKDVCKTCGGTMFADARTGQTPETSFVPPAQPPVAIAALALGFSAGWLWYEECGDTTDIDIQAARAAVAFIGLDGGLPRALEVLRHAMDLYGEFHDEASDIERFIDMVESGAKHVPEFRVPVVATSPGDPVRAALEFYANPDNWVDVTHWEGDPEMSTPKAVPMAYQADGARICDCGDRARAALSVSTPPY